MYNLCIPSKLLSHFISPEFRENVAAVDCRVFTCTHSNTYRDRALFDLVAIVSSLV